MKSDGNPFGPKYILGGVLVDRELNFRFEVWALRRLSAAEMESALATFQRNRDRRRTLRDKTVRVLSHAGMHG